MPYSGDNKREFTCTKDGNRLTGKLMFGNGNKDDYYGGLRFGSGRAGRVSVIDTSSSTGGDTTIEAGIGEFNELKRREGNKNLDISHTNLLRVGDDSRGGRLQSIATYRRTYSDKPSVVITENGSLGRLSSSERYKVNLEKQFESEDEQLKHSKKILDLNIMKWNDKLESEILCDECETGVRKSDDDFKLRKYVGLTSEKVNEVGLSEHVHRNVDGELEGISYDKLWIHIIPIIKDQQARIEELEASK